MIRIILMFVTLFVSSSVFADSHVVDVFSAVSDKTDLSIHLLSRMFGSVEGALTGSHGGGSVIAVMFKYFNYGLVSVAAITIGWSVLSATFNSAHQGSWMSSSQNKSLLFTVIRIPVAVALLLPLGSGYSTYQGIVMKVVVEGSRLADTVWTAALVKMDSGGLVYAQYSKDGGDAVFTFANRKKEIKTTINSVYNGLYCMYLGRYTNVADPSSKALGPNAFTVNYSDSDSKVSFGGEGSQCGSLAWGTGKNADTERQIIGSVINNLSPSVQSSACQQAASASSGKSHINDLKSLCRVVKQGSGSMNSAFSNAFVSAYNLNADFINSNNEGTVGLNKAVQKTDDGTPYTDGGWIMAGSYFWTIANINDNGSRQAAVYAFSSGMTKTISPPKGATVDPGTIWGKKISSDSTLTVEDQAREEVGGQLKAGMTHHAATTVCGGDMGGTYCTQQGAYDTTANEDAISKASSTAALWGTATIASTLGMTANPAALLIAPIIIGIATIPHTFANPDNLHPVVLMQQIGMRCIHVAAWGMFLPMAIMAVFIPLFVCRGQIPLGTWVQLGAEWIKPIVMGLASALLAVGAVLAFYVPLYPFFVFTAAAVGWFIAVFEAMIAAPLVCLGLTHPEGHDFLGKSEQAIMLLLGVFLRPVLLVIGFIAAIAVSYAAFDLLNLGFAKILMSMPGADGTLTANAAPSTQVLQGLLSANGGSFMFGLPIIMIIYVLFVMNLLTIAFKPITMYVDILKWIGGPQANDSAEQVAQKMEGSVQGAGRSIGDMSGKMGSGESAGSKVQKVENKRNPWTGGKLSKKDSSGTQT